MPPKKSKKGKKGKKGKEEPEPEDGYMTMKGEQLQITIENLKEKLQDAKIKRNMLQIEKDMIHDFYHNTREEIKELEARVSNFDTLMQNSEESHRTDIISHMQKVKHLEYEHLNSCDGVKGDAQGDMTEERNYFLDNEKDNLKSKGERKEAYSRDEMANIAEVEEYEKTLQDSVNDLKHELDLTKKALIENYEHKLEKLEAELELRMKVEIHEIEERKNEHINELMMNHETAFREMKQYFNDITRENLELIKVHKEKLSELKTQTATNENLLLTLKNTVEDLKEPLAAAQQKANQLKKSVETHEKDTMALRNAKGFLKDLKTRTKQIKDDRDSLEIKFKKCT